MFPTILGWINFGLLLFIISPFFINLIGRKAFRARGARFNKFLSVIRKAHKPLGVVLLAAAFAHGFLMLGSISLHTGLLAALAIAVIVALGLVFFRTRKKAVFLAHRAAALACLALVLVHLISPNLLYMLGR